MTPEGRIKRGISAVLKNYNSTTYYYMPVPGGYGESTLDYIGCCRGHGFAIEAKAPHKKPTLRQQRIIERMFMASMKVFVINNLEQIDELNHWLNTTSSGMNE